MAEKKAVVMGSLLVDLMDCRWAELREMYWVELKGLQ
jgi:hypothetical protein